jgi:hypothetical protein
MSLLARERAYALARASKAGCPLGPDVNGGLSCGSATINFGLTRSMRSCALLPTASGMQALGEKAHMLRILCRSGTASLSWAGGASWLAMLDPLSQ